MRTFILLLATAVLLGAAEKNGQELFMKCAPCHGQNGDRTALGQSKKIAEMPADEIFSALEGYKRGDYGGPMKRLMRSQVYDLSPAQMLKLADFIGKGEVTVAAAPRK